MKMNTSVNRIHVHIYIYKYTYAYEYADAYTFTFTCIHTYVEIHGGSEQSSGRGDAASGMPRTQHVQRAAEGVTMNVPRESSLSANLKLGPKQSYMGMVFRTYFHSGTLAGSSGVGKPQQVFQRSRGFVGVEGEVHLSNENQLSPLQSFRTVAPPPTNRS